MKKYLVVLVTLLWLSPIMAFGQGGPGPMWRGSGGWGPGSSYNRMFDPKAVETVSGEVVNVDRIVPSKGMSNGVHVALKTDKETISVHLGPSWYLENQDVKLEKGDRIEVTGSKVTFRGKPAIIASELRKGGDVLMLRDKDGMPMWSAWRRR